MSDGVQEYVCQVSAVWLTEFMCISECHIQLDLFNSNGSTAFEVQVLNFWKDEGKQNENKTVSTKDKNNTIIMAKYQSDQIERHNKKYENEMKVW